MLTKEQYEAKRQARYNRLLVAAERAAKESESSLGTAREMASDIPFGQPILVGHHSEGRDRNYRGRIQSKFRKGFELYEKSKELQLRAAGMAANDAIYSDDPEAVEKLDSKLESLLALQARYKAINAAHAKYQKNPASLDKSDLSEADKKLIRDWHPHYAFEKHPIQPFTLSNLSARIRTAKQRAEQVEKKQAMHDEDFTVDGVRVEGRPSENRIRVYYPARVDPETFRLLRQHGFRALRSEGEGAFSAYYNNNAAFFVKTYIRGESNQ
jgi:hypothetical protein